MTTVWSWLGSIQQRLTLLKLESVCKLVIFQKQTGIDRTCEYSFVSLPSCLATTEPSAVDPPPPFHKPLISTGALGFWITWRQTFLSHDSV